MNRSPDKILKMNKTNEKGENTHRKGENKLYDRLTKRGNQHWQITKAHLALSIEETEQQLQHDDFFVGEQNLARGSRVPHAASSRSRRRGHHPLVIQVFVRREGQRTNERRGNSACWATNENGATDIVAEACQALYSRIPRIRDGPKRCMKV